MVVSGPHADDFSVHSTTSCSCFMLRNDLFDDGSSDEHREKQCITCGDWIVLGKVDTGNAALVNHEGKKWCQAKVERNKQMQESIAAAKALDKVPPSRRIHLIHIVFHGLYYSPLSPLSFVSGSSSSMYALKLLWGQ
jgi:hypothetical protein